ncbi:hypothetical protein AAMO2058_000217400 [Amorphochlora amoebiformis]
MEFPSSKHIISMTTVLFVTSAVLGVMVTSGRRTGRLSSRISVPKNYFPFVSRRPLSRHAGRTGRMVPALSGIRRVSFKTYASGVSNPSRYLTKHQSTPTCPPLKKRIVVDVRKKEEGEETGIIPYTDHVQCDLTDDVEERIEAAITAGIIPSEVDEEIEIIVYCASGKRAARFADGLKARGFDNVEAWGYTELADRYSHAHLRHGH